MGVADHNLAAADMLDAPGRVAEQKNVAGVAFDREILIERADDGAVLIIGDDAIVGDFRNGPAAHDGRQARPLAGPQPAIDLIPMQVRSPPAAPRGDPFAQHLQHSFVVGPAQDRQTDRRCGTARTGRPRPSPRTPRRPRSAGPGCRAEPAESRPDRAGPPAPPGSGPGIRSALPGSARTAGPWAPAPANARPGPRAAGTWQSNAGVPSWQTRSMWPMSMPSSSDAVATTAFKVPSLSRCSVCCRLLMRQAAMMRQHLILAQPFRQLMGDALGQLAAC